MKKFTIFFLLVVLLFNLPIFGQEEDDYIVRLRMGKVTNPIPGNLDEWAVIVYADIFDDDNNYIPPNPPNYYYIWYKDFCTGEEVRSAEGPYGYLFAPDGHNSIPGPSQCDLSLTFETYYIRVEVVINRVSYYSGLIRVPDDESGLLTQKQINITQKREDQNPAGTIGTSIMGLNKNYPVPITFYTPSNIESEIFRATQELVPNPSNPNEKYNNWLGISDVINHKTITFSGSTINLTSQLGKVYDATVKGNLLDAPSIDAGIKFMDPWLIDDDSDPIGLRNRGTSAPFLSVADSSNNLGISTQYQGIFKNQNPNFLPNIPNYSVQSPSSVYLTQTGRTHNLYWQSWNTTNATLQYPNSSTTGVVFTDNNASATANVKGAQLSSQTNAYENNSQRKFVRSDDGVLHSVYESLNRVWYEYSTDNGTTWQLGNSGKPLDSGEGKQPSIDYALTHTQYEDYYQIFVVYQEKSGSNSLIKLKYFHSIGGGEAYVYRDAETIGSFTGDYSSANATPVICSYGELTTGIGNFTVVWKRPTSQLYARYGYANVLDGIHLPSGANTLTGTTVNSVNPTLYSSKSGGWVKKLAWEEIVSGTSSSIKYATLVGSQISGSITTPSAGSGVAKNYRPSIIEYSGGARLCWKGDLMGDEVDVFTVYKNPASGGNYFFGYYTAPPSINKGNDNSFIIAWSQENGTVNKFIDNSLSVIKTLNTSGIDIQVCNGANKNSMYGMVFKSTSTPKYFTISNNFGSFYKKTEPGISSGRQGVVYKDNAEFYFMVGDVKIDGQVVDFVELPDSILFNNSEELNQYLISEPFLVNDNSTFTYSVRYGVTDSSSAVLLLNDGKQISFKLQLFDYLTGVLLGEFDEVIFNSLNVNSHNNLSFQINTNGIGNREVVLKLVTENNFNPEYSLATRLSDENVLPKADYKEINYKGILTVESYDLAQNYPNPFNPATTIKYQIPEDGLVTLKIYDILGKEIKTLVNEHKQTGRYEVNFDASDFASGVYIYRIQVNDFVSAKKMMLVK